MGNFKRTLSVNIAATKSEGGDFFDAITESAELFVKSAIEASREAGVDAEEVLTELANVFGSKQCVQCSNLTLDTTCIGETEKPCCIGCSKSLVRDHSELV